ncbi:MAG TPA: hypothetical protein DEF42_07305 [Desulfosporosinus sp.]|nr:hypothetical protein [Desulfosporosinus sp.]
MSDLVISADEEASVQSFPFNSIGMLIGAFAAGIGLFLIGSPTSGPVTAIVGFILFLLGVIIFTL